MAIKKDAAKADIKFPKKAPTKETVDTPISECEAENPMECKYHGLQAFKGYLQDVLPSCGFYGSFKASKMQGNKGFEAILPGFFKVGGNFVSKVANVAKDKGLTAIYEGKIPGLGHQFLFHKDSAKEKKKKSKTAKVAVAKGIEEMEVDNLSPKEAKTDKGEEFDILPYIGDPEGLAKAMEAESQEIDDADLLAAMKVAFPDKTESSLMHTVDSMKEALTEGTNGGKPLNAKQVELLEQMAKKLPGNPYANMAEEMLKKLHDISQEVKNLDATWIGLVEELNHKSIPKEYTDGSQEAKDYQKTFEDYIEAYYSNDLEKMKECIEKLKKVVDKVNSEGQSKPKGSGELTVDEEALNEEMNGFIEGMDVSEDEEDKLFDFLEGAELLEEEEDKKGNMDALQLQWDEILLPLVSKHAAKGNLTNKDKSNLSDATVAFATAKDNGDDGAMTSALLEAMGIVNKYELADTGDTVKEVKEAKPEVVEEKPKEQDAKVGSGKTYAMAYEGKLEPLEHDEAKFPQNMTKEAFEKAIEDGESAGGHGGLQTTIVQIGGRKYICKNGSGKKGKIVKNGYYADMAYRAAGVYAPDGKLYDFGDGKTYKLSEFIDGKRLIDVWKGATEERRDEIRKELLKGYPVDVLFSNHDVLGTSPEEAKTITITGEDGKPQKTHVAFDNIVLGEDGHAYRIDNDGAFAMTGTGGQKVAAGGAFTAPVDYEGWTNWAERQWIDDFRTMRLNERNAGVFDRYSTADIFLSAANVNFDAMEKELAGSQYDEIRKAMLKPLFEMKQMALYAHGAEVAGYKNQKVMEWTDSSGNKVSIESDALSMSLDAIYNAHKAGIRKFLQKEISWLDTGWLSGSLGSDNAYVPKSFNEPEPIEPDAPPKGTDVANEVLEGIKTIAYHVKQGDFTPNKNRIKKALAVKPFVEVMAAEGNEKAKGILDAIKKIEESIETGHKKALTFDTADGMYDVKGLSLVVDGSNAAVFNKAIKPLHDKWEDEHGKWLKKKTAWDEAELQKAKAAGAAPTKDFQGYEDKLVSANINTNGIQQGGGEPTINHESKSAQKGTSFSKKACLKKVRQYAMMGLSLDEMDFANDDKTFYNGNTENGGHHVSGGDGVENYKWAVDYYRNNPKEFKKAMQAYAVHKGMMVLVHANMDNPAIDHDLLTCFVMRGEHMQAWGKDGKGAPTKTGIIDSYPIDSSTSACINATGHFGTKKIGWKLPIWRITDNFMIGAGSEEEININPINIPYPPMYFANTGNGWQECMNKYNNQPAVKAVDKKLGKKEVE